MVSAGRVCPGQAGAGGVSLGCLVLPEHPWAVSVPLVSLAPTGAAGMAPVTLGCPVAALTEYPGALGATGHPGVWVRSSP